MTIATIKYGFASGFRTRLRDGAATWDEVLRLRELAGGHLQKGALADAVIDDPDSILRPHFTWDIKEGWYKNLVHEAGTLLRGLVEIEVLPDGETVQHRSLIPIHLDDDDSGQASYEPIAEVLADEQMLKQYKANVCAELRSFQRKHRHVAGLELLHEHIDAGIAAITEQT